MEPASTDFDFVYRTHYAGVRRLVFRLVNNSAIVDDLTQDTFVKAYRAWAGFRAESSVRTWLFRIAHNVCLDYLRSPFSREQVQTFEGPEESFEVPETATSVASTVRSLEMTACVRQFVADLPETLRVPLVLRDLEGFSNAEVADLLECSQSAAKMRLHRARRKLQQMVEQRCDLFHDERNVLACLPGSADASSTAS